MANRIVRKDFLPGTVTHSSCVLEYTPPPGVEMSDKVRDRQLAHILSSMPEYYIWLEKK